VVSGELPGGVYHTCLLLVGSADQALGFSQAVVRYTLRLSPVKFAHQHRWPQGSLGGVVRAVEFLGSASAEGTARSSVQIEDVR